MIEEGAAAADARDATIVREAVRNVLAVVDSIIDYCLLLLLPALEHFDSISLCLCREQRSTRKLCFFVFLSSSV